MTGKDAMLSTPHRALAALVSLIMLALSLTLSSPVALAQNSLADALRQQSEFLPVREAYQLDGAVTSDGQLRLYWRIAEGYYLYQHAFKVVAQGAELRETLPLDFPPAIAKTDEFFGDVSVYYDEVDLRTSLAEGGGSKTLAVTYQGCADAGLCYPPETEYLQVECHQRLGISSLCDRYGTLRHRSGAR
jgi:thiol:disulfide interchange protein DsbD